VDSTSACGEQIKDDIDDHVLLAADESSPADLSQDVARVDAVLGGCLLGMTQEARVDPGVPESQRGAVNPHRPVLERQSSAGWYAAVAPRARTVHHIVCLTEKISAERTSW